MRHLIIVTGHLTTKPRQQQCVDLIKKIKKSYPDIDILYATHDKNIPNEIMEYSSSFVYTKNIIMNWDHYTENTKKEVKLIAQKMILFYALFMFMGLVIQNFLYG